MSLWDRFRQWLEDRCPEFADFWNDDDTEDEA